MVTIRINEFKGYGLEELTLFLKEADDNIFEIVIPKETTLAASTKNDIAWEFFSAAYIGQRLYELSSEFCYISAKPAVAGIFGFHIATGLIDQLAGFLFQASGVFGNSEVSEPINFALDVGAFITYFKDKPAVCQDLLDIANEYHTRNEE